MNQDNNQSKRRIAILHGSDSDKSQMTLGVEFLRAIRATRTFEITDFYRVSIHRNNRELHAWMDDRHRLSDVDVMVMGAGCAAHLPGVCDAYLRNDWKDTQIVVVGVGFQDPKNWWNSAAAELSISQVPGTQVVCGDARGNFVGEDGFVRALRFAVEGELPKITIPEEKPSKHRTFDEMLTFLGLPSS
ncbi:MAG: AIR carboxylase family protein [Candidatus Moranbacteria bacterium]|nr:AIR carboxylase family protein [Candidatus Moranbacteria bacterium]